VKKEGGVVIAANRVAFVWGDGAIKGGFMAAAADVTYRLLHECGAEISAITASSASVGNVLYFLSFGDDHPGREMWTETLCDPRFLRYEGLKSLYSEHPIYDIDFLVDHIFREKFPLNIERIKRSKIEVFIAAQDYDTGELVYFTNGSARQFKRGDRTISILNMFDYDLYELIRAASAAPFVFDRPVRLGDRRFVDAGAIESFAMDLPVVRDDKKVFILSKGSASIGKLFSYWALVVFFIVFVLPFRSKKLKVRHYIQYASKTLLIRERLKLARDLVRKGEAVILVPQTEIGSNFDNSKETLIHNYTQGVAVAEGARDAIIALLGHKA
jgi:predicted patatin/cPLA2 family phospholipase